MNVSFLLAAQETVTAHGEPASRFYQHMFAAYLIAGLLSLLLGLLVGWLAWRHCCRAADSIQTENQRLEEELNTTKSGIRTLTSQINKLEQA